MKTEVKRVKKYITNRLDEIIKSNEVIIEIQKKLIKKYDVMIEQKKKESQKLT